MASKEYNGHKNWNHWNVCLHILNNDGLYNMACRHVRRNVGKRLQGAADMLSELADAGITHTPDGAPYSVSSIRAAMVGM